MDISDFIKKICLSLSFDDYKLNFSTGGEEIGAKTTAAFFTRIDSPIFYIVNVIHYEAVELLQLQKEMDETVQKLVPQLQNDWHCNRIVILNILACSKSMEQSAQDFIDSFSFSPDERIHTVYWVADVSSKTLVAGKDQPTDIMNLKELVMRALMQEYKPDYITQEYLKKQAAKDASIKEKSKTSILTRILISINIAVFLYMVLFHQSDFLIYFFGSRRYDIITNHEYYRMVTSMFIHAGLYHIGFNCISLYVFGSIAERYYGKLEMISIYFISGIAGSLLSLAFSSGTSVGASGAIYGLIGAVGALSRSHRCRSIEGFSYTTLLTFAVIGISMGFMIKGVDNFAHIGGVIAGAILGFILRRKEELVFSKSQ